MTTRIQRIELGLFALFFFTFAYFHQGGGWNQNARFAEVRAIVEQGRFAIDDYLVYERIEGSGVFRRNPLVRGSYERKGAWYQLAWVDGDWNLSAVDGAHTPDGAQLAPMVEVCASGDIGYVPGTGHFHPNKPPGTSILGVPAYWVLYRLERWMGIDPDHWWVLTLNGWMTSACSVGVVAALGCIAFFRLACSLDGIRPGDALLATIALGLGTTFFPFATLFFDHAATAAFLVAAFYLARVSSGRRGWVAAGAMAGCAALTNYLAAVPGFLIVVYLCFGRGRVGWAERGACFTAGVAPCALFLGIYGQSCFGSPLHLNNDFQNPLFKETGPAFLGMFSIPQSASDLARMQYVASLLLFSPIRGVFYLCPVVLAGGAGFLIMVRGRVHLPEARLCLAVVFFFLLANVTFNGFHAGHSAGPRYLIPALPFALVPMAYAAARFRWVAVALCSVSVAIQSLLTATDAQNPTGIGGYARVEGAHSEWTYDLLGEYAWPLFSRGKAWPLLLQQVEVQLEKEFSGGHGVAPGVRAQRREELLEIIRRGGVSPFLLASIQGPVSVNPVGMFEGALTFGIYGPETVPAQFASFNAGEFLFPRSRWSLAPLGLVWLSAGAFLAWSVARREFPHL